MTERKRLIGLIEQCSCHYSPPCTGECGECYNVEMYDRNIEHIADHLLANGVIVPPVKIGDTVYYVVDLGNIVHGQVLEIKVLRIEITDEMRFYAKTVKHYRYNYTWFGSADFGKTVFLTREEAEKALEERSEI